MGASAGYGNSATTAISARRIGRSSPWCPRRRGMDEDYDACDLENWFLHPERRRPGDHPLVPPAGIVRYDGPNLPLDWDPGYRARQGADSLARILRRSRLTAMTRRPFRPVPDPTTGKIKYDVDTTATVPPTRSGSTWLSGPARRARAVLQALFAFMVIG